MALYRYEAIDRSGRTVRGAMNAADEQAVAQRLAAMGYALKAVVPAGGQATPRRSAKARTRAVRPATQAAAQFPVSTAPSVSLRVLARFYRQLAMLVRAGMPIFQALDDVSSRISNGKLRRAAEEMKSRVQSGHSLSSAMAPFPHLFPVHTVGLIWAGELGGYLDVALDEAATVLEQEAADNRTASIGWLLAKLALFSLILLAPVGFNPYGFMKQVALTSMAKFTGSPTISQAVDLVMQAYWGLFKSVCIPLFIAWIVIAIVWYRLKRLPSVRRALDLGLLSVPVWGRLHRARGRERFLRTLARQYQSGVAPAQAWAVASMTVRNSGLASRLRANEQVMRERGGTLQQALEQSRAFEAGDASMVGTGERAGAIPEALERLSNDYESEVSNVKVKGRMVAIEALILPLLILTGYMVIKIVQAYLNFVFDAPKILGIE